MTNGLSILIPIYNVEVTEVSVYLSKIVMEQKIEFEIRIYDDGSDEIYRNKNRKINIEKCVYIELEKNIGRSAIRNKLVQDALYNMVLILDCDIKIKSNDYIIKYIPFLDAGFAVSGGTEYEDKNTDFSTILHWKAGREKEQKPYDVRNLFPYQSFTLNNLLIPKSMYLDILLDEKIKTYGHEDSKFGIELEQKGVKLVHIDNAVYHIGLNTAQSFISKSISAAENLAYLVKNENIGTNTKLYKTYTFLNKIKIIHIYIVFFKLIKSFIYKNLASSHPNLFFLDLIKLHAFASKISIK